MVPRRRDTAQEAVPLKSWCWHCTEDGDTTPKVFDTRIETLVLKGTTPECGCENACEVAKVKGEEVGALEPGGGEWERTREGEEDSENDGGREVTEMMEAAKRSAKIEGST